jgi:enterochelin esterase family protein
MKLLFATMLLAAATASAQKSNTAELNIPSKAYPSGRHVWVYTPAGYPASCGGGCNLILAFDGSMYLAEMPIAEILDSLVAAKKIKPAVAVLFDNGAPPGRTNDLANSSRFAAFVAEELMPWVRSHYLVTRDPANTIITGTSAGGLGAAYVAMKHPELFGNVLSQSGAFWRGNEASNSPPYEWLTDQFAASARRPIRFVVDVGSRETVGALGGSAPSLLNANKHLADVLKSKGYAVEYYEVPNGVHAPESWRTRLAPGIVALLPIPTSAPR